MTDLLEGLQAALPGYRIERELGGGGMSRVFLAEETALARRVVVKVLPPELGAGVNAERFRREIQLAAGLQHPHIVPLLTAGQAGELFYYTMPFIQGDSLRTRLAREGELPITDTVRILRDVTDALAHAHEQGVVHRDIKPDNVLISGKHAVVTDFGVAKAISAATGQSALTSAGVALGTPAYMAPEQAAADPHTDHRADIYAVGAMAYEMLTGQPPFAGLSPQAMLVAHVTEAPNPVTTRRAAVPEALASLVMRCLEKKPADRYQSAEELRAQLELLATPSGGMTPTSAQPAPTAPAARRAPSRRAMLWGAAVLVLAAAVAATGYWTAHRPTVLAGAERIAILPLAPATPDSALRRLGQSLVVTLSANLEGVGAIHTVDAMTVLAQAPDHPLTAEEGAALAQKLGARSYVHGTLVSVGPDVRADLGLYPAAGGNPLARASVTVPAADVAALTDSVTWALLRQVWRSGAVPTPSITAITTRSLPALRAFVDGEAEIAKSNWSSAANDFRTAYEADSTFWLAYWRYAYAAGWYYIPVDSTVRQAYERHRDQLPERERMLVEAEMDTGLVATLAGYRAVAQRFPDYLPGAFEYADRLAHSGGPLGYAYADARAALDQAVSLSTTFTPAFEHRFFVAIMTLDSTGARRDLATLTALGYTGDEGSGLPMLLIGRYELSALTHAADTSMLRDSLAAALEAMPSGSGFGPFAGGILLFFGSPRHAIEVNDRLLRSAGPALAALAREGNAFAWAERGAWDSALAQADRLVRDAPSARTASDNYGLAVTGEWLGELPSGTAEARHAAAARLMAAGDADDRAHLAWLEGLSAVNHRDAASLDRARLAVRAAQVPASAALDRSLGAFALELAGNRRAAADSLAHLAWATADRSFRHRGRYAFLMAVNHVAAARWQLALGDTTQAERLMRFHEAIIVDVPLKLVNEALSTQVLLDQARIAEARHDTDAARTYYRMFLWRFDRPSAARRAWVDEARAALARLGGGSE